MVEVLAVVWCGYVAVFLARGAEPGSRHTGGTGDGVGVCFQRRCRYRVGKCRAGFLGANFCHNDTLPMEARSIRPSRMRPEDPKTPPQPEKCVPQRISAKVLSGCWGVTSTKSVSAEALVLVNTGRDHGKKKKVEWRGRRMDWSWYCMQLANSERDGRRTTDDAYRLAPKVKSLLKLDAREVEI